MVMFELGLVFGLILVASSPSPYYGALGLMCSAGVGCLVLMEKGVSILCLVLFLVYLGGMMVVFAYSSSLIGEQYPEAWGSVDVVSRLFGYSVALGWWYLVGEIFFEEVVWVEVFFEVEGTVFIESWFGVALLFTLGGKMLMMAGWALLLTLFGVLEVVRGHYSGALRAL